MFNAHLDRLKEAKDKYIDARRLLETRSCPLFIHALQTATIAYMNAAINFDKVVEEALPMPKPTLTLVK